MTPGPLVAQWSLAAGDSRQDPSGGCRARRCHGRQRIGLRPLLTRDGSRRHVSGDASFHQQLRDLGHGNGQRVAVGLVVNGDDRSDAFGHAAPYPIPTNLQGWRGPVLEWCYRVLGVGRMAAATVAAAASRIHLLVILPFVGVWATSESSASPVALGRMTILKASGGVLGMGNRFSTAGSPPTRPRSCLMRNWRPTSGHSAERCRPAFAGGCPDIVGAAPSPFIPSGDG